MDIRLHIGAHRTGTQHLRQTLLANQGLLDRAGVHIPDVMETERAFGRATKALSDKANPDQVSAELLEILTGGKRLNRLVIIDPNIAGSILRPMGQEFFYPRIGNTITRIRNLLAPHEVRLFISVRNPGYFVPSCYAASLRYTSKLSFEQFTSETNLPSLRWSDFLHRAQLKDAEVGATVWRFEDYPMIWRDVAQALTGIPNKEDLTGSTGPINKGISIKGGVLLHAYLVQNPPQSREELRRILVAFEQRYPSQPADSYPPHWPVELIDGMSENYEDDWYYIERMENVETIQPRKFA